MKNPFELNNDKLSKNDDPFAPNSGLQMSNTSKLWKNKLNSWKI